jgi:putative transposase
VKLTRRQNYPLYPTVKQQKLLARIFGACRWVQNQMLELRSRSYKEFGFAIGLQDTKTLLSELKSDPETQWLSEIPSQPLQEAVIDLDNAFQKFFRGEAKYPRFKKRHGRQSLRVPQPKVKWGMKSARIFIPNFKVWIRFDVTRPIGGEVKGATIAMDETGKFFVSFVVHEEAAKPAVAKGQVGVDLGLKDFAVMSSGEHVASPKYLRKAEKKLKRLQRSLSRKQKGSKNRTKVRLKVAKIHKHIANQRTDFLHKLSRRIVDENQVIAMETLNVKGMVKNPHLAKSISDSGWGMFVAMVKYKSVWAGRSLRLIDQWSPSSKMCGECGEANESLTLDIREWTCAGCGTHHDRDLNAAKNILKIGWDTPEYTPVERRVTGSVGSNRVKTRSKKQESIASIADFKSA